MKKEFLEYGLATFAADLEVAVRTFEKSIQDVRDATGRRSGPSGSGIKPWGKRGCAGPIRYPGF
jgi:hypothetical protein